MAKIQRKFAFSNAVITKENGVYMITEYEKNDMSTYNLSEVLDEFLDKDGTSLNIGVDGKPTPVE
ncbi:MAG: YonK family protein [Lachnospiraceae bacterium]|nr:YonK family protein [Lachnospiraceae bacterium]